MYSAVFEKKFINLGFLGHTDVISLENGSSLEPTINSFHVCDVLWNYFYFNSKKRRTDRMK